MTQGKHVWTPLEDGEYEGQHRRHWIVVEGEWLAIREPDWDEPGQYLDISIAIYDDLRLCRLVTVEGGAAIPDAVIEAIRSMAYWYSSCANKEESKEVEMVRAWLDSLQEGNDGNP
jgi:hypothetical protein